LTKIVTLETPKQAPRGKKRAKADEDPLSEDKEPRFPGVFE